MEKKRDYAIQELAEMISRDKKELEKQFAEVEEKYPLVMLAYRIQQAVIYIISGPISIADSGIGSLYDELSPIHSTTLQKLKVEQSQRLINLKDCLFRAHTSGGSSGEQYMAGAACFDIFAHGDDREVVND